MFVNVTTAANVPQDLGSRDPNFPCLLNSDVVPQNDVVVTYK